MTTQWAISDAFCNTALFVLDLSTILGAVLRILLLHRSWKVSTRKIASIKLAAILVWLKAWAGVGVPKPIMVFAVGPNQYCCKIVLGPRR